MMATATEQPAARRTGFSPTCVILGAALALVMVSGCLNPRPEDFPSSSAAPGRDLAVPVAPPVAPETCDDNALLAGCSPAEANGAAADDGDMAGVEAAGDAASDADAGAAPDAGADVDP